MYLSIYLFTHVNQPGVGLRVNPFRLCARLDCLKKLTRVATTSPRASLGRRTVCGRTEQLSAAGFEALQN